MKLRIIILVILLTSPVKAFTYGIGLMPLHPFPSQADKTYGRNISLHGTPLQVEKLRKWLAEIAQVPKGLETLEQIQQSGHKLFIYHSNFSVVSSGRTSAPISDNLINGRGESVDILFNANIPDYGSHRVFDSSRSPIEYTAAQNLYHELAHALHMMKGTWRYFKSERQAIEEENVFRLQEARLWNRPFSERVYVSGLPICSSETGGAGSFISQDLIC